MKAPPSSGRPPRRRLLVWATFALFLLVALPFVMSLTGLLPWSPINCWHYDVDLRSGRIRYTRYIAFLPIEQRIDETALSKALPAEDNRGASPVWRRALTLSPGVRNSPHYAFHSAITQMQELELVWRSRKFTPAARRSSARHVLELWQEGQSDDAARDYLRALWDASSDADSEKAPVDEQDLPAHGNSFRK